MNLELVDILCRIISLQNEIIKKQDEYIAQTEIGEAAAEELLQIREEAEKQKRRLEL